MKEINAANSFNIPGFKGMYHNGIHYKFGKKVFFENERGVTDKDTMAEHFQQMHYKV
jgi:hypothetical protein